MGNDKSNTNIISLHDYNDKNAGQSHAVYDVEDVSDFIVDMLDTLMRMAAKKDQSTLVYFLAMARIEAMEMKEPEKT